MDKHVGLAIGEDGDQVVQGHKTEVGIIVDQLGEKLGDRRRGRVGRYSLSHLERSSRHVVCVCCAAWSVVLI